LGADRKWQALWEIVVGGRLGTEQTGNCGLVQFTQPGSDLKVLYPVDTVEKVFSCKIGAS
jgi:hypothetical protein